MIAKCIYYPGRCIVKSVSICLLLHKDLFTNNA